MKVVLVVVMVLVVMMEMKLIFMLLLGALVENVRPTASLCATASPNPTHYQPLPSILLPLDLVVVSAGKQCGHYCIQNISAHEDLIKGEQAGLASHSTGPSTVTQPSV